MKDLWQYLSGFDHRVLMTVFPHPDDETMATGGLLMAAREMGWKTVVVSLTAGEAGQNYLKTDKKTLREIRMEELTNAIKVLGVNKLVVGRFIDGKIREQEKEWSIWVKYLIREYNPGLVATYDHTGFSGHPDHISVSVFSESLNLPVLWAVPGGLAKRFVNSEVREYIAEPVYKLGLGGLWFKKWRAAECHKSQNLGKSLPLPLSLAFALFPYEYYFLTDKGKKYPYKYVKFKI
jgi:LmbE family N-acetylglucosaminyl deacetylase